MTERDEWLKALLEAPLGEIPALPVETQVEGIGGDMAAEWGDLRARKVLGYLEGRELTDEEQARYNDLTRLLGL